MQAENFLWIVTKQFTGAQVGFNGDGNDAVVLSPAELEAQLEVRVTAGGVMRCQGPRLTWCLHTGRLVVAAVHA